MTVEPNVIKFRKNSHEECWATAERDNCRDQDQREKLLKLGRKHPAAHHPVTCDDMGCCLLDAITTPYLRGLVDGGQICLQKLHQGQAFLMSSWCLQSPSETPEPCLNITAPRVTRSLQEPQFCFISTLRVLQSFFPSSETFPDPQMQELLLDVVFATGLHNSAIRLIVVF